MRILVLTRNAWDDTNSIGNTVSNFFRDIPDAEFANLYFRSSMPNNALCTRYYRVTEKNVLRNWFTPSNIGRAFDYHGETSASAADRTRTSREKKLISLIHKYNLQSVERLSDAVWDSKKWINQNLDDFIEDFAPDLMFSFVKALPQYYQTICYLREKFGIPLLTWIADDEYTGYLRRGRTERIERLRRELDESAVVKGCSQEICDYYNAVFGCHATPLYKGCDLSTPIKERVNDPVRIVYAGNLLFGRLDVLRAVSDALEHCAAASGKAVCFDIYSSTPLSDPEIETYFGRNPCTVFKGAAPYAEIKTRLSEADIVLLAESFEDEEILKTRYSFSTKIIDYLQSGSVILAVGPECLASIRYLRRIPGTFVIDQMESIQTSLPALLNDADHFSRRAAETRAFAAAHHDAKTLAAQLYQLLQTLETDQRTQP